VGIRITKHAFYDLKYHLVSIPNYKRKYIETAEIVSINPQSPNLGGLFKAGGHPQTPVRKYPASLFQHYHIKCQNPEDNFLQLRMFEKLLDVPQLAGG
jgi:hypothetical protein